jgi:hypothetical protein
MINLLRGQLDGTGNRSSCKQMQTDLCFAHYQSQLR